MPKSFQNMGADAIFSKLDSNGTGSVTKQDFVNGMKSLMSQVRHVGDNTGHREMQAPTTPAQTLTYSLQTLESVGKSSSLYSGSLLNTTA